MLFKKKEENKCECGNSCCGNCDGSCGGNCKCHDTSDPGLFPLLADESKNAPSTPISHEASSESWVAFNRLRRSVADVGRLTSAMIESDDFLVTKDGFIGSTAPIGVKKDIGMSSFVFTEDQNGKSTATPAIICNTSNDGLRYVAMNQDGAVYDVGPVMHLCVVGNLRRPQALLIPLTEEALSLGQVMTRKILDRMHYISEADYLEEENI